MANRYRIVEWRVHKTEPLKYTIQWKHGWLDLFWDDLTDYSSLELAKEGVERFKHDDAEDEATKHVVWREGDE